MNNRLLWIAVAVVGLYLLYRWGGSSSAPGLIKVTYDRIGQARDAMGNYFNSVGWNPGR